MSRGLDRERALVKRLRGEGYWALRSPASLGTVDVVALKYELQTWEGSWAGTSDGRRFHRVRFIEVKSTSAGPFHSFGPDERKALAEEAERFGATAELCWWPPDGKGPRFILSQDWPKRRGPKA